MKDENAVLDAMLQSGAAPDPAAQNRQGGGAVVVRRSELRLAPTREKIRRDSKRDALLVAAREEFAASGFLGTHIAVIATRVGIRKSTFFHYFDGKESLYDAAVGEVLNDLVNAIDACGSATSFGERIDAIIECLQHHADVDAALPRLLLRALVDAPPPGTPRPTPIDRLVDRLAETVTLGVREGRVPSCDTAQAALSILGVVCLRQRAATTPLETRGTDQLIGETPSMRLAETKAQVRRLLAVR
jgi:AcrR family transcriptional regulator